MAKVNWTTEQAAEVAALYESGMSVEDIADTVVNGDKQPRSKRAITQKLVHMGVYITPEKPVAAPKDEGPSKKELQAEIAILTNQELADGLAGAKRDAIAAVLAMAQAIAAQEVEAESAAA